MSDSIAHGVYSSYTNHGCRCARCVRANTVYMREYRKRQAAPPPELPLDPLPVPGKGGAVIASGE